jgi:hypothetical protein
VDDGFPKLKKVEEKAIDKPANPKKGVIRKHGSSYPENPLSLSLSLNNRERALMSISFPATGNIVSLV